MLRPNYSLILRGLRVCLMAVVREKRQTMGSG